MRTLITALALAALTGCATQEPVSRPPITCGFT
jgi:hypothetical protein